jgi:hypothetical protein
VVLSYSLSEFKVTSTTIPESCVEVLKSPGTALTICFLNAIHTNNVSSKHDFNP